MLCVQKEPRQSLGHCRQAALLLGNTHLLLYAQAKQVAATILPASCLQCSTESKAELGPCMDRVHYLCSGPNCKRNLENVNLAFISSVERRGPQNLGRGSDVRLRAVVTNDNERRKLPFIHPSWIFFLYHH